MFVCYFSHYFNMCMTRIHSLQKTNPLLGRSDSTTQTLWTGAIASTPSRRLSAAATTSSTPSCRSTYPTTLSEHAQTCSSSRWALAPGWWPRLSDVGFAESSGSLTGSSKSTSQCDLSELINIRQHFHLNLAMFTLTTPHQSINIVGYVFPWIIFFLILY